MEPTSTPVPEDAAPEVVTDEVVETPVEAPVEASEVLVEEPASVDGGVAPPPEPVAVTVSASPSEEGFSLYNGVGTTLLAVLLGIVIVDSHQGAVDAGGRHHARSRSERRHHLGLLLLAIASRAHDEQVEDHADQENRQQRAQTFHEYTPRRPRRQDGALGPGA